MKKKAQGVVKNVLGFKLGGGGTSTQVYLFCYVGYYLTTLGTHSSCIAQSSPQSAALWSPCRHLMNVSTYDEDCKYPL